MPFVAGGLADCPLNDNLHNTRTLRRFTTAAAAGASPTFTMAPDVHAGQVTLEHLGFAYTAAVTAGGGNVSGYGVPVDDQVYVCLPKGGAGGERIAPHVLGLLQSQVFGLQTRGRPRDVRWSLSDNISYLT